MQTSWIFFHKTGTTVTISSQN